MKKVTKVLSSLLVALMMTFSVMPQVSAQETNTREVLEQIQAASSSLESMQVDGHIALALKSGEQQSDLGQFNFDMVYNIDPRFSAEFNGEIISAFLGSEAYTLSAWAQDGVAYLYDGMEDAWTVEDYSAQEQDISDQVYQAISEAEAMQVEVTDEYVALVDKYLTFSETETDFVYTVNENINAQELWADLDAVVDLEAIREEAIAQAKTQATEQGIEFSAEDEELIRSMYSVETLETILATNPHIEVHYAKDTYKLSKMIFNVTINPNDFMSTEEEVSAEEAAALPENIMISMEMNFSNYGQAFDITVPAEATQAPVETEETVDSADDVSTEEVIEESTEDATEETTEETETVEDAE